MTALQEKEVARRYAQGLFHLAQEGATLDVVHGELREWLIFLNEQREIATSLHNPTLSATKKANAIEAIMASAKASELTQKFLVTLARNNRITLLPAVVDALGDMVNRLRGDIAVDITSANALSLSEQKTLTKSLESALGGSVIADFSQDPSLIAGVTIRRGSLMLDCSAAGKIARMEQQLHQHITESALGSSTV